MANQLLGSVPMASIRARDRKDGTTYAVLFTLDGKQTSVPWYTEAEAEKFRQLVESVGGRRAMEIEGVPLPKSSVSKPQSMTVQEWLNHHIDHLTGVEQGTLDLYRMFVRVDIAPVLGSIPLAKLTEEDIGKWVTTMATTLGAQTGRPPAASSVAHKHAFLSGALAKAVPRHIPANPAAGRRLPKTTGARELDDIAARMLSRDEFDRLLSAVTEPWRPLVLFLVASGCRWGEAAALKPSDVNRGAGTVRVTRAWKHSASGGYTVGTPKTRRSKRTINLPADVLNQLDYTHEWLFTNRAGGPVRYFTFRGKVWKPAAARSGLKPEPKIHDLRHTCASWMLNAGVPITTVSRHLGHESINITADIYGDVDRSSHQAAADVMGILLAREPQKAIEARQQL
jgi:integrase